TINWGGDLFMGTAGSTIIGSTSGNNITVVPFEAHAQGGTSSGDGGKITVSAGHNLIVFDGDAIDVTPQGATGNGGELTLAAATGTPPTAGNLVILGNLDASGAGTGEGGRITLSTSTPATYRIGPNADQ